MYHFLIAGVILAVIGHGSLVRVQFAIVEGYDSIVDQDEERLCCLIYSNFWVVHRYSLSMRAVLEAFCWERTKGANSQGILYL